MKIKFTPKYNYEGLHFPIELINVTLELKEGKWLPKINQEKIAQIVIRELPFQKERLTGNQVKFIRSYFKMSMREFAQQVVKESHGAVANWEHCLNHSTKMDINIEILLRLYILEKLLPSSHEQGSRFFEYYMEIRRMEFSEAGEAPIMKLVA